MSRRDSIENRCRIAGAGVVLAIALFACCTHDVAAGTSSLTKKVIRLTEKMAAPGGMAMDRRGNMYVVDTDRGRVELILPDGDKRVLAEGLTTPTGIAVDAKGRVYISEATPGRIQCILPGGTKVLVAEGLNLPSGLLLDRDGDLFVSCKGNGSIIKIEGVQKAVHAAK